MKKIALIITGLLVLGIIVGCNPAPKKSSSNPTGLKVTGPQTFVAKGQTPEQHVKQYYKHIIDGQYAKAYAMLPALTKKKETQKQWTGMFSSFKIKSYKIEKVQKQKQSITIMVSYDLGQYGKWNAVWAFANHQTGWIVASSSSAAAK